MLTFYLVGAWFGLVFGGSLQYLVWRRGLQASWFQAVRFVVVAAGLWFFVIPAFLMMAAAGAADRLEREEAGRE